MYVPPGMELAKVRGITAFPLLRRAHVPTVMELEADTEVTEITFGKETLDNVKVGQ